MKEVIQSIFKRIIYRCFPFVMDRIKEYQIDLIKSNPHVELGSPVQISHDSKIETRYGGKITLGDSIIIFDGVLILSDGGSIEIGNGCQINPYTIIYGTGKGTKIGENVLIAGHCMIIPSNHNYQDKSQLIKNQGGTSDGIVIEDDVWIGHGCTITDGVTIGKGSVIAAGSVVTQSVPPYSVFAGVPARRKKFRGQ